MLDFPVINCKIGIMETDCIGLWTTDSHVYLINSCLCKHKVFFVNNLPYLYWSKKEDKGIVENKIMSIYKMNNVRFVMSTDRILCHRNIFCEIINDYDASGWANFFDRIGNGQKKELLS